MVFDASPRCRNDRMEVILLPPLSSIFRIIVSLNKRVSKLSMIIGACPNFSRASCRTDRPVLVGLQSVWVAAPNAEFCI